MCNFSLARNLNRLRVRKKGADPAPLPILNRESELAPTFDLYRFSSDTIRAGMGVPAPPTAGFPSF